ncbi:MAG: hypothetical protein U9N61_02095 [Euryarchaeota archaeon]|nr:hypothetical protein [Euryarchaeota archaeon]
MRSGQNCKWLKYCDDEKMPLEEQAVVRVKRGGETGVLVLEVTPVEADLYIDYTLLGRGDSFTVTLHLGKHHIRLENEPTYIPQEFDIEIVASETNTIDRVLKQKDFDSCLFIPDWETCGCASAGAYDCDPWLDWRVGVGDTCNMTMDFYNRCSYTLYRFEGVILFDDKEVRRFTVPDIIGGSNVHYVRTSFIIPDVGWGGTHKCEVKARPIGGTRYASFISPITVKSVLMPPPSNLTCTGVRYYMGIADIDLEWDMPIEFIPSPHLGNTLCYQVYVNGIKWGEPRETAYETVEEVEPGTHDISVAMFDTVTRETGAHASVSVEAKPPDARIIITTMGTHPKSVPPGGTLTMELRLKNVSDTQCNGTITTYIVGFGPISWSEAPTLEAGETKVVEVNMEVPEQVTSEEHTFGIMVDTGGEYDTSIVSFTIIVTYIDGVVVLSESTIPSEVFLEVPATFTLSILNTGTKASKYLVHIRIVSTADITKEYLFSSNWSNQININAYTDLDVEVTIPIDAIPSGAELVTCEISAILEAQ